MTTRNELKKLLEDLKWKSIAMFEYMEKVKKGELVYKKRYDDDFQFEAQHPEHPEARLNRQRRIHAADTFWNLSETNPELMTPDVLDALHEALFDCNAAVRQSTTIALRYLAKKESLPFLKKLLEHETESKMVKTAAQEAIERIEGKEGHP